MLCTWDATLLLRQRKGHLLVSFFRWRIREDLKASARERERDKRRRWRKKRSRASEQIRSIGSAPRERDRDDYICEVRRRKAARESLLLRQQKTHFCLPTKVRFLNDVCLRQMMLSPPMMTASPNDVCLTAHWGKHRIIATNGSNIILSEAKNITSPQAMHHLTYWRFYDIIAEKEVHYSKWKKLILKIFLYQFL